MQGVMQFGRSGNIPVIHGKKAVLCMNKVILMGRLVADPETRYTPSNTSISRFRLAVNRGGKPQEGQPTADFFEIVTWQKTADFVGKYFKKGMQVLVEGRLRNDQWTDKDGQKHYRTEVTADQVYFAEGRREGQGGGEYTPTAAGNQRDYGNNAGNSAGSGSGSSHPGGNSGSQGVYAAAAPSNVPVPETGDGFYTLNEDDEDLPF